MSAPRIILASLPSSYQNYQNWWTFDEVLTKTILHSFLDTVYFNKQDKWIKQNQSINQSILFQATRPIKHTHTHTRVNIRKEL